MVSREFNEKRDRTGAHEMMTQEKIVKPHSGWAYLAPWLGLLVSGPAILTIQGMATGELWAITFLYFIIATAVGVIGCFGFMAVQPNQARVLLLFGDYIGTVREAGFYWVNPFYSKKKISLRVRNFETGQTRTPEQKGPQGQIIAQQSRSASRPSKVNDRDGNPIEISAVVVWKVVDTAEAMFEVDDYEHFVEVQSEAALRSLATRHPYDGDDETITLRGDTEKVSEQLREDIQARLDKAGVETIEARISHLAYSPEIAAAMLQRQQAQAVVAARTQIVEGAVGMVDMALSQLAEQDIVELDDERRAAMVSNLLVVLCSDRHTQPVVNTGTIYN